MAAMHEPQMPSSDGASIRLSELLLDNLLAAICRHVGNNPTLNDDTALCNLIDIVVERSQSMKIQAITNPHSAEEQSIAAHYIVRGYERLANELNELWIALLGVFNKGDDTCELFDKWLQQAEMPGQGVLAQIDEGNELLEDLETRRILLAEQRKVTQSQAVEDEVADYKALLGNLDATLEQILRDADK